MVAALVLTAAACAENTYDATKERDDALSWSSTLASGQHRPMQIAVDATHVYWTAYPPSDDTIPFVHHYSVMRVSKSGGPVEILSTNETEARGLVVDDSHVYWINSGYQCGTREERLGAVRRVAKSGGRAESVGQNHSCKDLVGVNQVVVDASTIYFSGDQGIRRLAKDGSGPVTLFAEAGVNPHASLRSTVLLRQDAEAVYWGDSYGPMYRQPKAGGAPTKLLDESPWELAMDSSALYWVKDGTVWRVKKQGGAGPEVVGAAGFDSATAITSDDTHLYYSNNVERAIRRIPKSGASRAELFTSGERAYDLAVDSTSLYFPYYGVEYTSFMAPEYVANSGAIRKRTKS